MDARDIQTEAQKREALSLGGVARRVGGVLANLAPNSRPTYRDRPEELPAPRFSPEPGAADVASPSFSPEPGAADAASPSEGTWYSDPTGADIHSLDVHREKRSDSEAQDVDLLALADRQTRSLDALRKKKSA